MKFRKRQRERDARACWWLGPASDALDRFQRRPLGRFLQGALLVALGAGVVTLGPTLGRWSRGRGGQESVSPRVLTADDLDRAIVDDAGVVMVYRFRDIPGYGTLRQPMTVIVTGSP